MARLNEIPAPVESVDALKRRFVRQNRELARINSNQSVRIRNLESEISRLLSENIAFRERVIRLQHEVDRAPGQAALDIVGTVRSKLEAKLGELGALVQELGRAHDGISTSRPSRRRSLQQSSPKKSPDQRNWKNALTFSEVTSGTETPRLPPIIEDKYFPRRTLESEELLGILDAANAVDSPELGPPPIATFDDSDPIKYDRIPTPAEEQAGMRDDERLQVQNIANLETRKKRRESSHRPESSRSDANEEFQYERIHSRDISTLPVQPLKAGAKRKLNIREDDEVNEIWRSTEEEALRNSRKSGNSTEPVKESRRTSAKGLVKLGLPHHKTSKEQNVPSYQEKMNENASNSAPKTRKALGLKSVNTDPIQSPAKKKDLSSKGKFTDSQDRTSKKAKDREQSVTKTSGQKIDRPLKKGSSNKAISPGARDLANEPETPAPPLHDVRSPQLSQQSDARPGSQDTPPPPDLEIEADAVMGRATRRPRGSVSYAEPNLRDKMRRPTNELIDAVGADDRPQIIKVEEVKIDGTNADKGRIRTVLVKREEIGEESNSAWKKLPVSDDGGPQVTSTRLEPMSPLGTKSSSIDQVPTSIASEVEHADKGSFAKEYSKPSPASESTIATLVAGSQQGRKRENAGLQERVGKSKDLFDLDTSSPSDHVASGESVNVITARSSRRHSSAANKLEPKISSVVASGYTSRRGDGRRESTVSSTVRREDHANGESELQGAGSVSGLQKPAEENKTGRAERSASRRRSMML